MESLDCGLLVFALFAQPRRRQPGQPAPPRRHVAQGTRVSFPSQYRPVNISIIIRRHVKNVCTQLTWLHPLSTSFRNRLGPQYGVFISSHLDTVWFYYWRMAKPRIMKNDFHMLQSSYQFITIQASLVITVRHCITSS